MPPGNGDEIYRGTITVTSRSILFVPCLPKEPTKPTRKTRPKVPTRTNSVCCRLLMNVDASATSDGLISEEPVTRKSRPAKPTENVNRRADEDVRTFDLAYENGRWVLKTDPDPKTEIAVKKAFEYALSLQQ